MAGISNRQAICDVLLKSAEADRDIVVTCSDSRGSASLTPFTKAFPDQFVEVGIAEQDLVGISAGLAACGKKVFCASPASFLTTRSYEQCKVDVAYSNTNVTLIGISGGVSYGALGMTHHSTQDFAVMSALTGMRVYDPSDRFETVKLIEALLQDNRPAYIRVSRNPTEDIYNEKMEFQLNRAISVTEGTDVLIATCGELVPYAKKAAEVLKESGISASVLDMYCIKPFDETTFLDKAKDVKLVVVCEEHGPIGGLGSIVAQTLCRKMPKQLVELHLPDEHLITGSNREMFAYYGLDEAGIISAVKNSYTR